MLRVFFDGVPLPAEKNPLPQEAVPKEEAKPKEQKPSLQEPIPYFHPPFLENQCDACHESKLSQKLILKGKELCFTCHDDFTKDKKNVHYPVSEGTCVECHEPHQAPNKSLLKKAIPEICFACHEQKDIRANSMHEGQNICTDCHNPHASNEEKLLK